MQIRIYFNGKQRIHSETSTSEHSLETHIYEGSIDFNKKDMKERRADVVAKSNNPGPQTEGNKSRMPSFLHIKGQMAEEGERREREEISHPFNTN